MILDAIIDGVVEFVSLVIPERRPRRPRSWQDSLFRPTRRERLMQKIKRTH